MNSHRNISLITFILAFACLHGCWMIRPSNSNNQSNSESQIDSSYAYVQDTSYLASMEIGDTMRIYTRLTTHFSDRYTRSIALLESRFAFCQLVMVDTFKFVVKNTYGFTAEEIGKDFEFDTLLNREGELIPFFSRFPYMCSKPRTWELDSCEYYLPLVEYNRTFFNFYIDRMDCASIQYKKFIIFPPSREELEKIRKSRVYGNRHDGEFFELLVFWKGRCKLRYRDNHPIALF